MRAAGHPPCGRPGDPAVLYAAAHKAGAVAVPTNTRLSVRELIAILGHGEVRALLTCSALVPAAREVRGALPSLELLVSDGAGAGEVAWNDFTRQIGNVFQERFAGSITFVRDVHFGVGTKRGDV